MQHHHINILNRRDFLSTAGKAGILAALGTVTNIPGVLRRALAAGTFAPNKKVFFIWMRGANDSLNSIIPIVDSAYASSRPTIGIPKDPATDYTASGLDCDVPVAGSGSTFGSYPFGIRLGNGWAALHPSLKFLAPLYNAGDLALIHRVAYPRQSRSHFDSQNYWENGAPNNNLVTNGIFYRAIVEGGLGPSGVSGVSIQSSLPLILRGSQYAMTNLSDTTRYDLWGIPHTAGDFKAETNLFTANALPYPAKLSRDLLFQQHANLQQTLGAFGSINFGDSGNTYRDVGVTDGDTVWANAPTRGGDGYFLFPTSNDKNGGWRRDPTLAASGTNIDPNKFVVPSNQYGFFTNVKAAALVLNNTDAVIAGTELNGFDTHQSQGQLTGTHPDLNKCIAWAMYALRTYFTRYSNKATWNDVVVVTLSEFGPTTVENSDRGTDHAEAGVMFVGGGAIKGRGKGNTYGVFNCSPADTLASNLVWVDGPTGSMFGASGRYLRRNTDYRSVLGEVIRKHLGTTDAQIARIIGGYGSEATEHLRSGGTTSDGTPIRGEVGIL